MCLWWSLRTLYLHACQVRVTVGDSGLCCTCVTYFERLLTPLSVDSARAFGDSFFVSDFFPQHSVLIEISLLAVVTSFLT